MGLGKENIHLINYGYNIIHSFIPPIHSQRSEQATGREMKDMDREEEKYPW